MGRPHSRWLNALSRAWVSLSVMVGMWVALPMAPAGAETAECRHVYRRLTAWVEHETHRGLTPVALADLQTLIPDLESCHQSEDLGSGDVERWRDLSGIYFAAHDVDRVLCLMARESGGDPGARNPDSGASGLMQVMPSWAPVFGYEPDDLFDPMVNLWIASQIADRQGWDAWSPYLRGSCR